MRFCANLILSIISIPFWRLTRDGFMAIWLSHSYGFEIRITLVCAMLTLMYMTAALAFAISAMAVARPVEMR